jgi:hypothetical protein
LDFWGGKIGVRLKIKRSKMFAYNKKEVSIFLSEFIWNFKLGDNIAYNFKILFLLYKNKDNSNKEEKKLYNKLVCVILVSIIEAILVDLLKRIDHATTDIPICLLDEHINSIKQNISKDKKIKEIKDAITGAAYRYNVMKKYDFNEIVKYCRKYNLLFSENEKIYDYFDKFAWLRNRIHIENYYSNFEEDEANVFTESRLVIMEKAAEYVLRVMADNYSRNLSPLQKQMNARNWFESMN